MYACRVEDARFYMALVVLLLALVIPMSSDAAPEGEMTWAVHVALAATWFDPAETSGIQTPFMVPISSDASRSWRTSSGSSARRGNAA